MSRTFDEELSFLKRLNSNCWSIKKGFVPNMKVLWPHLDENILIDCFLFDRWREYFM